MTYFPVVINKELLDVRKQITLVVKPKEKQRLRKTNDDLNNNVDTVKFKVTNVENRKKSAVVIQNITNEEQ